MSDWHVYSTLSTPTGMKHSLFHRQPESKLTIVQNPDDRGSIFFMTSRRNKNSVRTGHLRLTCDASTTILKAHPDRVER